jgi:hypothetical protein
MASILALAQNIADELSLGRPSALIGDTVVDDDAYKLFRFITRSCKMIAGRYDWTVLQAEQTFTSVAQEIQTSSIPTDFKRFINDTFWNRSQRRIVEGPLNPQTYSYQKANVNGGIRDQFRVRGNDLLIYPAPSAGETMAYEYITNYIGTDTLGVTYKAAFTVDTDIPLFDDELVILGAVWRYKKAEGQDYSEEFNEYENRIADEIKNDGGRDKIRLDNHGYGRIIKPIYQDYAS